MVCRQVIFVASALKTVLYVGNLAVDTSRSILEAHAGPGEGSPYKVLGYGI